MEKWKPLNFYFLYHKKIKEGITTIGKGINKKVLVCKKPAEEQRIISIKIISTTFSF